ncbi:E3 ubiquitin-protein ligase CBL-C isoform 2 [Mus musculus]|uniref:E3 ubiquitin-protein ligase CBL n=1 Tax=Mus musculus TaxID=10090 RepID=G3X9U0_MOUSE|nr:E3 ubiquitin-protein ligase CBL-C isoform 2 [Mus musculus]EDL23196.1 Casitas B-lineage lymphoma c, isoform CRA_b [Mus musculus]|eukprot:NP_001155316.1 E3 ubiquitin-protein ligase CBL-C isoform 2 [Mus musculus]
MAAAAAPRGWQRGEPRALSRAVKLLQRLEEQCRDPRMVTGPPSLRDLLPRTAQLLGEVAKARREAREDPEGPGGADDFLAIYLANLEVKGRQVAELLPPRGKKDVNQDVFREGSRFRRQLAKLALIFSHMHAELSALFPAGKYCGHLYQLTKGSAHIFWRQNCGVRCVLPWAEFQSLLCACHPVEPGPTMQALRSTLDLTCNGHVSVFEFDVFTRLFQPWPTLLRNWQLLAVNHPGYMAFLTYDEVQTRLQAYRDKPGSYIFRPSCTRLGQWAIGYVSSDGSILQTIPLNKPLLQVLLKGQKDGIFLFPDGKKHNPDLTELCRVEPYQRIQVSEDSDSQTCPFCRCEIKGREAVSICQAQERPTEVRTAADGSRDNCHQEAAEQKLGPVIPSAPSLLPEDQFPQGPQDKGWLTLAPLALPRLRPPLPLPKMASVLWEVTSRPRAREEATESS